MPTGETALTKTNVAKKKGKDWKNKANALGRPKLKQGRNCWQLVKHAGLYSDLPQALKGEH